MQRLLAGRSRGATLSYFCSLLVAREDDDQLSERTERMKKIRLGEGCMRKARWSADE